MRKLTSATAAQSPAKKKTGKLTLTADERKKISKARELVEMMREAIPNRTFSREEIAVEIAEDILAHDGNCQPLDMEIRIGNAILIAGAQLERAMNGEGVCA